jgi:hypothetical protein
MQQWVERAKAPEPRTLKPIRMCLCPTFQQSVAAKAKPVSANNYPSASSANARVTFLFNRICFRRFILLSSLSRERYPCKIHSYRNCTSAIMLTALRWDQYGQTEILLSQFLIFERPETYERFHQSQPRTFILQ